MMLSCLDLFFAFTLRRKALQHVMNKTWLLLHPMILHHEVLNEICRVNEISCSS